MEKFYAYMRTLGSNCPNNSRQPSKRQADGTDGPYTSKRILSGGDDNADFPDLSPFFSDGLFNNPLRAPTVTKTSKATSQAMENFKKYQNSAKQMTAEKIVQLPARAPLEIFYQHLLEEQGSIVDGRFVIEAPQAADEANLFEMRGNGDGEQQGGNLEPFLIQKRGKIERWANECGIAIDTVTLMEAIRIAFNPRKVVGLEESFGFSLSDEMTKKLMLCITPGRVTKKISKVVGAIGGEYHAYIGVSTRPDERLKEHRQKSSILQFLVLHRTTDLFEACLSEHVGILAVRDEVSNGRLKGTWNDSDGYDGGKILDVIDKPFTVYMLYSLEPKDRMHQKKAKYMRNVMPRAVGKAYCLSTGTTTSKRPDIIVKHTSREERINQACEICPATFASKKALAKHNLLMHSFNSQSIFDCKLCVWEGTLLQFRRHQAVFHKQIFGLNA